MGKFRVPSWLQAPQMSFASSDAEKKKKHNRRSLPAFSRTTKQDPIVSSSTTDKTDVEQQPKTEVSRLIALARKIVAEAEKLDAYLRQQGSTQPGFNVDAPSDFPMLPADIQRSRQEIVYATQDLGSLVRGPRESVRWTVWTFLDALSLQIIHNYGIANLVPVDKPIALAELQTKSTLNPTNLARALRHVMTNHIFCEPEPGIIAHTAASRLLAEDKTLQDWVGFCTEDVFLAAANVLKSLKTYPDATSITTTGFNFAFDTVNKEPMFVTLGKDPFRAKRMGAAMASLAGGEGYETRHFIDSYDFSEVDKIGGTFVDIGGSHGFVSVDLAKKWKNMKFIVQDLPKTVESAPKPIDHDRSVAERIQLEAHDFFKEQPVKDADVYFFRWIMHNYSTPYAIKILRNLVPALKPGARVIINDHCLREPGAENAWDEKLMRGMDMIMLILLNAQERQEEEFRELFEAADERFAFKGVTRTPDCRMSVIEAVWEPQREVNRAADESDNGRAA